MRVVSLSDKKMQFEASQQLVKINLLPYRQLAAKEQQVAVAFSVCTRNYDISHFQLPSEAREISTILQLYLVKRPHQVLDFFEVNYFTTGKKKLSILSSLAHLVQYTKKGEQHWSSSCNNFFWSSHYKVLLLFFERGPTTFYYYLLQACKLKQSTTSFYRASTRPLSARKRGGVVTH